MLPENILREHIESAIQEINDKGVERGAHSSTYDIVYNGKRYPPKLVLSIANKYANGAILPRDSFKGGEETPAFQLLERLGFKIDVKNKPQLRNEANLKQEFAKWLLENAPDSYNYYLGGSTNSIVERLNEISRFFPEQNFFKVDASQVDQLIREIKFVFSTKERRKNVDFLEYDKHHSNGIPKAVMGKNNYIKFLQQNFSEIKIDDNATNNNTIYSWVKTHKQLSQYLLDKETYQIELIEILKSAGATLFNDQNPSGNTIPLEEIDPFTFYCYVYKYGTETRLNILQNIAKSLDLFVPDDDSGIPSTNPQKVWLFPYKFNRRANEIKRLWNLFYSALNKTITEELFQDVLQIRGVAHTKLTEALFYVDPENYFPINGPSKPYLNEVLQINPDFSTFADYKNILEQIKNKTEKPFYQLSYEAWMWNDQRDEDLIDFKASINKYNNDELVFYFKHLDDIVDRLGLTQGDKRVVYSCTGLFLNFNIGQRVAWRIDPRKDKKYHIMTKKSFNDNTRTFDGEPLHYYHVFNSQNELAQLRESSFEAYKTELKRTTKSGYKKFNNKYFENAVFDKAYRNEFIKTEVMENETQTGTLNKVLNQILYGPPGTGKTYSLKHDYFPHYTTQETSITAEKHFESVVKELSWWEVIAIALIQLGTSKVNAIYDHKWVQKKSELSNSKTVKPTLWGQLQSHTIEECENVNVKSKQQPLLFNKTEDSRWEIIAEEVENQVPELYELIEKVENFKPNPDKVIERFKFVTFHQSFSYEDFIEGIKPIMPEDGEVAEDLGYKIEDGVFKEICKEAALDPDNKYAIFIDEINRGNVSAIFGELITLIETDKRKDAANEMFITLPYSKKTFSVPSNLDIYGTMNTADRSVEALDTALRRRFEFKEMMPDLDVIEDEEVEDILLSDILKKINERIELLIDRDHTIGHSYFVGVDTKEKLVNAFNNKIMPLLQEYFYGDYGKIGLVLGKGFVQKIKNDTIEFASFDYENANDFKTPTFVLKHLTTSTIIEAVKLLLGHIENIEKE